MAENSPKEQMLKAIPHLRAFAISLSGSVDKADDLVQGALLKGLTHLDKFEPGTSMQAWLFTILRNDFLTQARRKKREVEDPEGAWAENVAVMPDQGVRLDVKDMLRALSKLPVEQREALLLVGAEGLSYEDAARICGTNIGTIKSRINRARNRLAELMSFESDDDLGPDRLVKAALFMHASP
ncbi:sigma-70 family RNA polymerase sigma factor [Microvirga arsenatis]|uniref:RNA polymerase sigma factor n=1 Tax=Microvirga arsenatis TaxID=2692265 RepID=A0ABW9YTZ9_9HYPH|nr:sigma-70 family RNA polymerase sigma factor [Microvirga arsenatis]NBJ09300.1 sigma-70 family RNA polymerase sigma factor [Microvirga arsenatis]NBJ23842.1 sigma-70 family RNA polymerase sigma factor [Microvirga arsenatis]